MVVPYYAYQKIKVSKDLTWIENLHCDRQLGKTIGICTEVMHAFGS